MPLSVQWPTPNALANRLNAVQLAAEDPSSPAVRSYRADLAGIVQDDHEQKMLRGVDRYGSPRWPLADSTLRNPRRGSGPSLIPLNSVSRYLMNFRLEWESVGETWVLKIGFDPILSSKGVDITEFHEQGCPLGSNRRAPNWSLPARPVKGITPAGMAQVRERHQQLPIEILSTAGRFGTYR